jgi:hypothetical protein
MSELEKILSLVEQLELELVEEGKIEDGEYESRLIGEIKEMLYNKSIKQISNKIDNSGFQGQNVGDGMSGFRG